MIIENQIAPSMGYSNLVELYGDEFMGFSIGKALRKTGSAVKSVAKVAVKPTAFVAKTIAKRIVKTAGIVKRNAGNIAVAATVVPTGGASLLAKKKVRTAAGNVASFTARKVVVPVAKAAAGNKLVQKATGKAIRSLVPGGGAALDALSMFKTKRTAAAPAAAPAARAVRMRAPVAESTAAPFPIVPVAIGGAGLLALLAFSMAGRKGGGR